MVRTFLTVLVLSLPAWADATAVIWGGGSTQELADASMREWAERSEAWGFVELAPGFPQVVQSDSLAGLKPGLFVVLLGVCAGATPDFAVDVLDALEPAVYTRTVKWSKPDACPHTTTTKEFEDPTWTLSRVERVTVNGAELSAFLVSGHQPQGSEFETKGWSVYVFLRKGKAVETLTLKNTDSDFATVNTIDVDGTTLVFEEKYAAPSCVMGEEYVEYSRRWRVSVKAGKLVAPRPTAKQLSSGRCGGG